MMKRRIRTQITLLVVASLIAETVQPLSLMALTSGPTQPEFSEFTPVGTSGMVDPFTGDFSYSIPVVSIPGPNGGGYSLALTYNSGKSGDDEASWVGKGWTLSPGAITRNMRGFPDDYNGQTVRYHNATDPVWTVTVGKEVTLSAFSVPHPLINDDLSAQVGVRARFNNYAGFSHTTSIGLDAWGLGNLGFAVTDGEPSYSFSLSPGKLLGNAWGTVVQTPVSPLDAFLQDCADDEVKSIGEFANAKAEGIIQSFGEVRRSTHFPRSTGTSYEIDVSLQGNATFIPAGLRGGISGTYSKQTNVPLDPYPAYGYMYSGHRTTDGKADYYVEKDGGYDSRDRYLGIPFSNADNFTVMGQGVGGGFRLFNRSVGEFAPATMSSPTGKFQAGWNIGIGMNVGPGGTLNASGQLLSMGAWGEGTEGYHFARTNEGDEPVFFRFTGDLGGMVDYACGTSAKGAGFATFPNDKNYDPSTTGVASAMNSGQRSGRAAYIGYHTNREMVERPKYLCYSADGPSYFKSYNKAESARGFVDRTDASILDGIGEIAITKADGMRYVYGLPVYARNERELHFAVSDVKSPDGYLVYKQRTANDGGNVTGEERDAPYATVYLLTEITTPDYVDRTNDGPTPDDLGGYTKFNYTRAAGSNVKGGDTNASWYKWRNPYRGMIYNRNSLSAVRDDIGSVSYGEKEVYYLASIETRTHIATFFTSARRDGYQADRDEARATRDSTATGVGGTNAMRKLDRIEMRAKNPDGMPGKLLTAVRMDYDYSLCRNLPNAETDGDTRCGSLTLKRLYFEYEGAVNARVSPYVFGYSYRKSTDYSALPAELLARYGSILSFADNFSAAEQNPQYSPFATDRWGYYRANGKDRAKAYNPWVDQNPDPASFDPAAYQLKWIQLPSGGEIHVQYEQDDYRYVQDRNVMAMASLRSTAAGDDDGDHVTLHLNTAALGITTDDSLRALEKMLLQYFVKEHNPIYFKYLYALEGSTPALANCNSEYVTGYVPVDTVEYDNTATPRDLKIVLFPADVDYRNPRDIARRFAQTNRAGILHDGICDPELGWVSEPDDAVDDYLLTLIGSFNDTFFNPATSCTKISLENSYVRIPINRDKKGGGLRVKRLLTYDAGIESGAASLYGQEFTYRNQDGSSSGVAANEPSLGAEESALRNIMDKRDPQTWIQKGMAGVDREQFEGPLGESILPGPSVGYARVVVRNIHTGATTTGYAVNEFYTARDYPFDRTFAGDGRSSVDASSIVAADRLDGAYALFTTYGSNELYRTQGYRFILNGMHGVKKHVAEYGGSPSDGGTPISEETYTYYEPGESIPLMYDANTIVNGSPGRETEVIMESRSVEDLTTTSKVRWDVTLGLAGIIPIPFVTGAPENKIQLNTMNLHVTTRVVRYPAIVKSVRARRDGIVATTEYKAFDPRTGRPVLVKSTDGYDGLALGASSTGHNGAYYGLTIPAWQHYAGLDQLALRERTVIDCSADGVRAEMRYTDRHFLNFRFLSRGLAQTTIGLLSPGDLVRITGTGNYYLGTFHIGAIAGNQVQLVPTYISNAVSWANEAVGTIEIIRSARTNQVEVDAGSVTTYAKQPTIVHHPLN